MILMIDRLKIKYFFVEPVLFCISSSHSLELVSSVLEFSSHLWFDFPFRIIGKLMTSLTHMCGWLRDREECVSFWLWFECGVEVRVFNEYFLALAHGFFKKNDNDNYLLLTTLILWNSFLLTRTKRYILFNTSKTNERNKKNTAFSK